MIVYVCVYVVHVNTVLDGFGPYLAINCKAETDKDASTGRRLGRAGCIWGSSWGADQNRVSLTI